MRDRVVGGAIVGLLANLVKLAFNFLAFQVGLAKVVFWQIAATRIVEKENLFQPVAYILGGISDLTTAAVIGVLFSYMLAKTGRDYLWVKGIGFGLVLWVILLGTLLGQAVQGKIALPVADKYVTVIAHLLYGLALAYFYKKIFCLEEIR